MTARLKTMSRAERLALMHKLLEPLRKYLPLGEEARPTVVDGEAMGARATGGTRLAGPRHSR